MSIHFYEDRNRASCFDRVISHFFISSCREDVGSGFIYGQSRMDCREREERGVMQAIE